MTVLCPKYINIRRGCVIAAIISAWVSRMPIVSSLHLLLILSAGACPLEDSELRRHVPCLYGWLQRVFGTNGWNHCIGLLARQEAAH